MALPVKIIDGNSGLIATVCDGNSLRVQAITEPPLLPQRLKPFRQFLTNGGGAGDSNDMQVDGSTINVDFHVAAHPDNDRYISTLQFLIADATSTMNKFGNITALTNGCQLFYERVDGSVDLHDALKSNLDFVRLCLGEPAFGDGAGAFRINNAVSTSEGYIPTLDCRRIIPPFGIKLDAGTRQRLVLTVKDDTQGVDAFNCIAYGFDREPFPSETSS